MQRRTVERLDHITNLLSSDRGGGMTAYELAARCNCSVTTVRGNITRYGNEWDISYTDKYRVDGVRFRVYWLQIETEWNRGR